MARNFSDSERYIKELFFADSKFNYNNKHYSVILSDKPTCSKGEPKTDLYILVNELENNIKKELKISFKKSNADFLENKISDKRALAILGQDWKYIINVCTMQLEDKFKSKPLIYKNKKGKTNSGSITLGWKFELLNKSSGELSNKIALSKKQVIDVYSGTNLPADKKNAFIQGNRVPNSGIANCLLIGNTELYNTTQDVINNIIPITTYVESYPDIYLACKALNYRTFEQKFDGNRPLCVFVDWTVLNNKLTPTIRFDAPLVTCGNVVAAKLLNAMKTLNITTTDDITQENISSADFLY
ncbi:hypothetical protein KYB31_00400 [Clostridium felsineum]|uniref:hypothetical protein n=1 Tax=Clostridium felsineum TaxID=36839 RepID=UPI00214DEDB5|nr:hypothetical protein [Clostridium felsineum]MCR3757450.1 hypothetical protein [Clostridium felsineum]